MKMNAFLTYIGRPSRIIVSTVLFLVVVFFIQLCVCAITHEIQQKHREARSYLRKAESPGMTEEEKRHERIRHSSRSVLPDGTIHLTNYEYMGNDKRKQYIYDWEGNLLWEGPEDSGTPFDYISWSQGLDHGYSKNTLRYHFSLNPEFSRTLDFPAVSGDSVRGYWRFFPEGNYFKGYNRRQHEITGYCGKRGFVSSPREVTPFDSFRFFTVWNQERTFRPIVFWLTGSGAYEIDFSRKTLTTVFESSGPEIQKLEWHSWEKKSPDERAYESDYRPLLFCITSDAKGHLLLKNPDESLTIDIPESWLKENVHVAASGDTIYLLHDAYSSEPSPEDPKNTPVTRTTEIFTVDKNGTLTRLNSMNLEWNEKWERVDYNEMRSMKYRHVTMVSSPLPPFHTFILQLMWWGAYEQRPYNDLARIYQWFIPENTLLNWMISTILAGLVFLHSLPRRTGRASIVFWIVFTVLLNLAGFLTYLSLNHKPVITCSHCKKRRGLEQEECVRCGKPLPRPKPRAVDLVG